MAERAKKPDVRTFVIDGVHVVVTRVPVRRHDWDYREQREGEPWGHPREQALYEIRIDGQHVGLTHRQHGFGRQWWNIDRLCPELSFTAGLGAETVASWGPDAERLWTLDAVAAAAVRLRREKDYRLPKLATEGEIKTWVKRYRERKAEEDRAAEARHQRWVRVAAEQKRRAEEHRQDVFGGLQSLDERLASQMTNYETSALRIAIAAYAPAAAADGGGA